MTSTVEDAAPVRPPSRKRVRNPKRKRNHFDDLPEKDEDDIAPDIIGPGDERGPQ